MTLNSGAIANNNGFNLEDTVENILKRDGYDLVERNRFAAFSEVSEQPIYAKQVVVGKTIYDSVRRCDFIIYHQSKFKNKLIIECKWQQSGGSVDEKYPFLVLNIKKLGIETIIILDGQGYKKGAEQWLKSEVGNYLKKVVNLGEFLALANKGFFR